MALIKLKTDPTRRELRQFGCLWLPLFCALGGAWLWSRGAGSPTAMAFWGVGLTSLVAGAIQPRWIRPVFLGLIYLTAPIGWVISHAVLVLVYYCVLTPTGLLTRLVGRDPIPRGFEPDAPTYWRRVSKERSPESYLRQY